MSFLSLEDIPYGKLSDLIHNSIQNKKKLYEFKSVLKNKCIGILFEKPSTRTRVAFQTAITGLGGSAISLSADELQISRGENLEQTIEVIAKYLDGLVIRTSLHENLKKISQMVSIPVVNALSEEAHPSQVLADMMSIWEIFGDFQKAILCYIGDASNNICRSLIRASVHFNFQLKICAPKEYFPEQDLIKYARSKGAQISYSDVVDQMVAEANILYTDVWTSMGYEKEMDRRKKFLWPYQINTKLLEKADKQAVVMHCMPVHLGEEITQDVFKDHKETILNQAENKLYTAKALLHCIYS